MLRFLVSRGLPEDRLSTVGLADTQLRDRGDSSAAIAANWRIEVHLIYDRAGDCRRSPGALPTGGCALQGGQATGRYGTAGPSRAKP